MMISFLRTTRGLAFAASGIAIGLFGAGCGEAPQAGTDANPPEAVQAIPPPDLDIPTKKPEKVPPFLYVKTAFQSESDYGTHDFPVGAKVAVLEKQGDSYLVELNGVAVLNGAEFFSETLIVDEPVASPTPAAQAAPVAATPTPTPDSPSANDEDYITAPAPGDTITSVPEPTPSDSLASTPAASPAPSAEPAPPEPGPVADSAEDRRVSELSQEIRDINEKIDRASSPGNPASEPEVRKLRKQREQLSEELTTLTKP